MGELVSSALAASAAHAGPMPPVPAATPSEPPNVRLPPSEGWLPTPITPVPPCEVELPPDDVGSLPDLSLEALQPKASKAAEASTSKGDPRVMPS